MERATRNRLHAFLCPYVKYFTFNISYSLNISEPQEPGRAKTKQDETNKHLSAAVRLPFHDGVWHCEKAGGHANSAIQVRDGMCRKRRARHLPDQGMELFQKNRCSIGTMQEECGPRCDIQGLRGARWLRVTAAHCPHSRCRDGAPRIF